MKYWKETGIGLVVLWLVAVILCTSALAEKAASGRLTLEDLEKLGVSGDKITMEDGHITFVDGACTRERLTGMEDAARVVASMTGLLGADERTAFEPWRVLTDNRGNTYYVFQQMYADTTVSGGAVKVVADSGGEMIALISSVEAKLPDVKEASGIDAGMAQDKVLSHALEVDGTKLTVIEELTQKVVLPLTLSISDEEALPESRFVWMVYTDNQTASGGESLPYLAHYVDMDGNYLYSLPTIRPGDEVGKKGFDSVYVFEFMEPAEYTGKVKKPDGTEAEVTVTLMRDRRTGMYYMGNIERRIVVADCYDFLYEDGRVVLESSRTNSDWDPVALMSLYNYCRAWDNYKAIGWSGGDGENTPIMILNNFCDEEKNPVDNACYIGKYLGWQLFGASSANQYSHALDIVAHEFTHCVTDSVMTFNAYMNDYGAINEAMSDIQGNLCEMILKDTKDKTWLVGENSGEAVRSMSDPHLFSQPEYAWDLFYKPPVNIPTPMNDQGGVHGNSSLLNLVAYRLCTEGGMPLEAAREYWFAVDCAMVPGTDYLQMTRLLPWVLENMQMGKYRKTLEKAIEETRMGQKERPQTLGEHHAMLTMTLPEGELFSDGNWGLHILTIDMEKLKEYVSGWFAEELPPEEEDFRLEDLGGISVFDFIGAVFEAIGETDEEEIGDTEPESEPAPMDMEEDLEFQRILAEIVFEDLGAAGQDGRTIQMVCRPGRTIPVLFHMTFEGMSEEPQEEAFAVFFNGHWHDFTQLYSFLMEMAEEEDEGEGNEEKKENGEELDLFGLLEKLGKLPMMKELGREMLQILRETDNLSQAAERILFEIRTDAVNVVPADGLENIRPLERPETTPEEETKAA